MRRLQPLLLLIAIAAAALPCRAQLYCFSFEPPMKESWEGPGGGGAFGGDGSGEFVCAAEGGFARTGERALCLQIWDNGDANAVSWAGITQLQPCKGGTKLHVGAWFFFSSKFNPLLNDKATAQIRVEYFTDPQASRVNPLHVSLSRPFTASGEFAPDKWHLVELNDRAPVSSRSMKVSIILSSPPTDGQHQAVWIDDIFVEFSGGKPRLDLLPQELENVLVGLWPSDPGLAIAGR
jgi:hypothetical protein